MTDVTIANDTPRQLGVARDYHELHQLLRNRADELNVSRSTLDSAGLLADGHASKILSPGKQKILGPVTTGLILQVLGLQLLVVEDLEALGRIKPKLVPRETTVPERALRWGKAGNHIVSKRWVRRIAREGGRARALALTPKQRSASARKAAKARWSKPRLVEVKGR
jgi:hypothetical protein